MTDTQGLEAGVSNGGSQLVTPRPVLRPQDPEGGARQRKQEYRCSLINLDNSQDEELDAILGELTMLQGEFDTEIKDDKRKSLEQKEGSGDSAISPASDRSSSNITDLGIHSATHSRSSSGSDEIKQGQLKAGESGQRTDSPDTDSAFCDNLSVLSSCSTASSNKTGQSINVPSSLPQLTKEEQEARVKAEKIKIAIEKIKEASVKKLFIKVFTCDGSAKSLLVDEKMTVGQVTRILAEKNHVSLDPKWALVELVPDLYMERVYEDNELLVENCLLWKVDSKNTLWFIERPEKIDLFLRPEVYLLGTTSSQRNEPMEEHCRQDLLKFNPNSVLQLIDFRQELVQEYFSSSGVGAPEVEGYIWLKSESKKSWKKFHFILRTSGLYYSPKGKKTSKDLLCLCTFDVNQVYYGVGWKRKFKAPTDHCFGIKHPQIQAKNPKYIRYLCVDTQKEMHQWVTGIRMAKNGKVLHDNYRSLVEEITHADLDMLVGKRGSTNSAMCLVNPGKSESCATNLHLTNGSVTSPMVTPSSENKSFDSALSSGIRSDHFMEALPASTTDLAKFDLRCNDSSSSSRSSASPTVGSSGNTLRRTSKSSSSLSDKSSGIEQGFESDHPAGGTIKKRPPAPSPPTAPHPDSPNIRLGAGGTLLRRSTSAERLAPGRNYEELQQLLDELHTNVRQAKDIQAKIKSSIEEAPSGSVETLPPPPPPPRTSSRLSLDAEELPPPPCDLQPLPSPTQRTPGTSTLPRKHLPPIAPKPSLSRVPGSPKFKPSYGTLPNPGKKSSKPNCDQKYTKSGRRISFDDNIQLIEDPVKTPPQPALATPGFLQGLERVVGGRLPPQSPQLTGRPPPSEPLYTSVVKPGSGARGALRYTPHQSPSPPRPVCCTPSLRCGGDSSPEGGRSYTKDSSYRAWRSGGGEGGDYWQAEPAPSPPSPYSSTPPASSFASLYSRGGSEEPRGRPCDDLVRRPLHSSVPSSPVATSSASSRLWGSFRGKSKPPVIDKRALSPYLKTAS